MKLKKTRKIICALLIAVFAVGVFLSVYGASMMIYEKHIKNSFESSYAVVSHLEENDRGGDDYIIAYSAEGQRFEKVYEKANKKTYIGETLELYYETGNPDNYYLTTGKLYNRIFAVGFVLTLCSLIALAVVIAPVAISRKLVKDNKWAMCKVIKLKKDGKNNALIYCDSSKFPKRKGKPFVSASIEKSRIPKNIRESSLTVYYSEKNPNFYYVDIDKLN